MMRVRTVLLHGEGPSLPVLAHKKSVNGVQVDLLAPSPDSTAQDLADRGLVRIVGSADPWDYDEVYRCSPHGTATVTSTDVSAVEPETTDSEQSKGRVVLVGGGPGSSGLITIDGLSAMHAADVVVCDRLAPLGLLDSLVAEIVHVGKIPHGEFTPQDSINAFLIAQAEQGKNVVRLKGGDGYVLGRGGEEYEACRAAGIPVEVIPGVSSSIAVPALAGIPVTHRGMTQGFVVVSGHVPPDDPRCTTDWSALAVCGLTLVVLMGVGNIGAISEELVRSGLSADTPAAVTEHGSLVHQRTASATLATIADAATAVGIGTPAVVVIGSVVEALPRESAS